MSMSLFMSGGEDEWSITPSMADWQVVGELHLHLPEEMKLAFGVAEFGGIGRA